MEADDSGGQRASNGNGRHRTRTIRAEQANGEKCNYDDHHKEEEQEEQGNEGNEAEGEEAEGEAEGEEAEGEAEEEGTTVSVGSTSLSAGSSCDSAASDKGLFTHTIDPDVRAMLEGIIDPVVVANGTGLILYVNAAACSMFGYEKNEIIHQSVGILMPKTFRDNHDRYMQKYADGAPPKLLGITRRLKGQTKQGQVFNVDISLGEFPFALAERGKLYVATFRDVKTPTEGNHSDKGSSLLLQDLLERNDLGQFFALFQQEDIDLEAFFHLNDELLQQLGIKKLGPRLKIMALIESSASQMLSSSGDASTPNVGGDFGPKIAIQDIKFVECIGRGSYGVVYRGLWMGREVAIKKLMHSCSAEAKLLSEIRHRNIVTCYGACLEQPDFCLIMELGVCNLKEAIRTRDMSPSVILDWSKQIATGMNYLHTEAPRKIIHRDLKPGNILLFTGGVLKITDFGLSRIGSEMDAAEKMSSVGTYEYMAPEVIKNQPYSEKCDVWSFGVLVWEMLTRQTPYKSVPSLAVAFGVGSGTLKLPIPAECPPLFRTLLAACFSRDYADRFSFKEILRLYHLIAKSEFAEVSFNELMEMQNSWQHELESSYTDFRRQLEHLSHRQTLLDLAELQLSQREAEVGRREFAMRQSLASDLVCAVTGRTIEEEALGYALAVSYVGNSISAVVPNLQLVCRSAFSTENEFRHCRKSLRTTHWVPLYLPDLYKKSALTPMIDAAIYAIAKGKAQFSVETEEEETVRRDASLSVCETFETISHLIHGVLETYIAILETSETGSAENHAIVQNTLQCYMGFHRIFLHYILSNAGSDAILSRKIESFVTNPNTRSFASTPHLGKLLNFFAATNYSWLKFVRVFIREFLQRTWPCIRDAHPEWSSLPQELPRDMTVSTLLSALFDTCRTGIRVLMLNVFFLRTFVRPTLSSSFELADRYDAMLGRPTVAQVEDLEYSTRKIMEIGSYNDFFEWIGATYLCGNDAEVLAELRAEYSIAHHHLPAESASNPLEMTIVSKG